MKAVQKFSKEYLEQCRLMTPDQIAQFLEDFRVLHGSNSPDKSRLISMKVPQTLLDAFRVQCRLRNIPYQSQIKILMKDWLKP